MKPDIVGLNLAKPIFHLLIIVCLMWAETESVNAHGIQLWVRVEGDTAYVESKFSGGKGIKAGKIIVSDSEGIELLSGTTDENGGFSFKVPKKVALKIVLEDGAGHRAEETIAANEIEMPAAGEEPDLQKDNTLKNMIIGIGCIFFLAAMGAFIRKRKKKN